MPLSVEDLREHFIYSAWASLPYSTARENQVSVVLEEWPAVYRQWDELLAGFTDEEVRAGLTCQDMRGQVSGFLRTMGRTPPILDLVYFYRLRA